MLRLIIGNKAYSSWSLRAWLAVKASGLEVEEEVIPLYEEGSAEAILRYSPTGKVPCLMDGAVPIWDSLAICEYLAELAPEAGLWPSDRQSRAVARAASAEMHAGFQALRQNMPMNVRKSLPGKGWPEDATARAALEKDIRRIDRLWTICRTDHGAGGDFLFGRFGIADCMYAPVVTRLVTYGVTVSPLAHTYMTHVMEHPLMRQWIAEAQDEPWVMAKVEL